MASGTIVGKERFDGKKSHAVAPGRGERAERRPASRQRGAIADVDGKGGAVILRVWRARLVPARKEEYRRFERERYMPMLHKQPGFLGVLFLRPAEDLAASLTIWEDAGAVDVLPSSPSYREIIHELLDSALLAGNQSVEILEVAGGDLRPEALARALERSRDPSWRG
jgi:heme-degrading monooxygenase HmoA